MRSLACSIAALGLGAAVCATPTAASASAATRHVTRIAFTVHGCDACHITPYSRLGPLPGTVVAHGRASLTVPTSATRGMAFAIGKPLDGVSNSVPILAVRYPDVRPGAYVGRHHSASERKAFACWAGTRRATAHVTVWATRFTDIDVDGSDMQSLRTWASPAMPSMGSASDTDHGAIGSQEELHC